MLFPFIIKEHASAGGWESQMMRQAIPGYSGRARRGGAVSKTGEVLDGALQGMCECACEYTETTCIVTCRLCAVMVEGGSMSKCRKVVMLCCRRYVQQ